METIDKIKIMEDFLKGEIIEVHFRTSSVKEWMITDNPQWDWVQFEYRVKPISDEIWINIYPGFRAIHNSSEEAKASLSEGGITKHYKEVL